MINRFIWVGMVAFGLVGVGCGAPSEEEKDTGQLSVRLGAALEHDVDSVLFVVVDVDADCNGKPLASQKVSLESEAVPDSLSGESGSEHAFSDALFVLAPGEYRVCATPMSADGSPSTCAQADEAVSVSAGKTNEVVLISQCEGGASGGLDVVLALNEPPAIAALTLDPSKFINACEVLTLAVTASDANEDSLTYSWQIAAGPEGAELTGAGASATFSGPVGDYELLVTVTDAHAADASLAFPVHVSECTVPLAVQDIFESKCSTCHTTSSFGGLSLADAAVSFESLVAKPSKVAACSDRTLVVPGDAAASYLVQKLLGTAGICGAPMPRGRDPLPAGEQAVIEDWINSL